LQSLKAVLQTIGVGILNWLTHEADFLGSDDFKMFRKLFSVLVILGTAGPALADPEGDCRAAAGSYVTGIVVSEPVFRHGTPRQGVELSHTHFTVKADKDSRLYDVAADNVFAAGYDQAGASVPLPLTAIHGGARVELCGQLYPEGGGIHWVHTNFGDTPSSAEPDGWLRIVEEDGAPGGNLASSTEYCRLWPRH
jgi:hypothetical protein